jgi:inosine/xanthosine triphosphatase
MEIAIGTTNKAKIQSVQAIVNQYFEKVTFTYFKAPSQVSDQPITTEETRLGAINRAKNTSIATGAMLSFGLEGGVTEIDGDMYICNWGALTLADGTTFTAAGAQIILPEEIAQEIRAGKELGPIMERYTQRLDIRQGAGAVGIFTQGIVTRQTMFEHIVALLIGQYLFTLAQK